uniref:Putative secreted peptide n=1 Tax=Anopheles braziliensis TaxID=58242 RepID=A0A2M3ZM73_9DIPT
MLLLQRLLLLQLGLVLRLWTLVLRWCGAGCIHQVVVVLQPHLCQRILMSQAGRAGRGVMVTETLVIVRVLSQCGGCRVRIRQRTEPIIPGVLAHLVHLNVRLRLRRQQPRDRERMARGRVTGGFLLQVHRVILAQQRRMTPIDHRRQLLLLQLLMGRVMMMVVMMRRMMMRRATAPMLVMLLLRQTEIGRRV